jgi:PAS domain S-box-containing protein
MTKPNPKYLVDGKYTIRDLVDMDELRHLFEQFTQATGFTIGFTDYPGLNVLIATGWRDICTKFHRSCPASAVGCLRSNRRLVKQLTRPNQTRIEPCVHGLVDFAVPIIVKGKHIANLATGQLLIEPPDLERFRRQARRYGYDEKKYLDALAQVPVVSKEQIRRITAFLGSLAKVVSELGHAHLQLRDQSVRLQRKRVEETLVARERRFRALVAQSSGGITILSETGKVMFDAVTAGSLLGFKPDEIRGKNIFSLIHPEDRALARTVFRRLLETPKKPVQLDVRMRTKKDSVRVLHVTGANRLSDPVIGGIVINSFDITERKQLESQLKTLNGELEEKVRERTARLQALTAQLTHAEHRERKRIAHVLHEDLQQRLVAMKFKLEALRQDHKDGTVAVQSDKLVRDVEDAIQLTRTLTRRLMPPVLHELGMYTALRWVAEHAGNELGLVIRVVGNRSARLHSEELQTFVLDAVRELLVNVIKHADVDSAEIRIQAAGKGRVAIVVKDKGKGCTLIREKAGSFGLFSIRERAEVFGAEFTIASTLGKGTRAMLILPTS